MNIADVVIVLVLLVSVVQAAISGFFQEAFAIAGAVFGYIVAAWQYQRLTAYISPYISSRWLAEIVAFLSDFRPRAASGWAFGPDGSLADKRSWAQRR